MARPPPPLSTIPLFLISLRFEHFLKVGVAQQTLNPHKLAVRLSTIQTSQFLANIWANHQGFHYLERL